MSLRSIVNSLTLVMFGLALVAALSLAIGTKLMHRATERLGRTTEDLRAVMEIESNLQEHHREAYLWLATGDAAHRRARDEAEQRLYRWLAESRAHARSAEELDLIRETERAVRDHVASWAAIEAADVPPLESIRRMRPSLGSSARVADRLVELNIGQADRALATSARLDRITDVSAVVLAVAMGFVALIGGILVRRAIYRPLLALRGAMRRFAGGDALARAETRGPTELGEAAHDFNDLADRLERQRADGLAFVGSVAHDLKNPLAALKAGALLLGRSADPGAVERRASMILRQVDRMDRMLGDFLDVSRIEAGRLELRPEPVDLAGAARSAAELFGNAHGRHDLVVSAPAEPVVVRADPLRLQQVLDNLLSNAIKYSPDGGRVDVRVRRQDGSAVLEVQDRGIGIAPKDRERIFEPFGRLETRSDLPGVGLGLSVTRRLVEGHGGRIAVESAPGRGSIFRVELPAAGTA